MLVVDLLFEFDFGFINGCLFNVTLRCFFVLIVLVFAYLLWLDWWCCLWFLPWMVVFGVGIRRGIGVLRVGLRVLGFFCFIVGAILWLFCFVVISRVGFKWLVCFDSLHVCFRDCFILVVVYVGLWFLIVGFGIIFGVLLVYGGCYVWWLLLYCLAFWWLIWLTVYFDLRVDFMLVKLLLWFCLVDCCGFCCLVFVF